MSAASIAVLVTSLLVVAGASLLKRVEWSKKVKHGVATALAVVGGGVAVWVTGDVDATSLTSTITAVYAASQLLYNFVLRGTPLNDRMERAGVKPKANYE